MNPVDLIILGLLALAIAHGVTQGAAMQVLSFGGFWAGLALGAVIAPPLSRLAEAPFTRAFVSMLTVFGLAGIGGAAGRTAGTRVWGALRRMKLGAPDAVVGAAIAAVATLVAVWLFALIVSGVPAPIVSRGINESRIVRLLVRRLPPAPAVFSRIQALVDAAPFPKVFAGLEPPAAAPVPLPNDPLVRQAVAAAGAATVKIFGAGCGGVQTGSGFVASPGLVITNAHVVAGIDNPQVQERSGRRVGATTVLFDPELDIAILRARVSARPLAVLRGDVPRGQVGAILGFPGGGGFTAGPGAVLGEFKAVGRDIYGSGLTRRDVYQVRGIVRPGNSGGPFVEPDGDVMGVIFAASTNDDDLGYAIASKQVIPELNAAQARTGAVDTGPCAA